MEKIYMEENAKKKKGFSDFMKGRGILVTSLLIVVVAVAAFVTASFNGASFAIEPDSDQMTLVEDRIISNNEEVVNGVDYFVNLYSLGSARVYCLQYDKDALNGNAYTEGEEVEDNGLKYLVALADVYDQLGSATTDSEDGDEEDGYTSQEKEYIRTFVMQTAIWVYQHRNSELKINHDGVESWRAICADAECKELLPIDTLYVRRPGEIFDEDNDIDMSIDVGTVSEDEEEETVGLDVSIMELVKKAERFKGFDSTAFKLSLDSSKQTEDGDYYIVGPISLAGATGVIGDHLVRSYTVKITSAVDGAEIIDKDGKTIKEEDALSGIDSFYIKAPIKSLTADKNIVSLYAKGLVASAAFVYHSEGSQDIGLGKPANKEATLNVPFQISVDTPNTGMTTAQIVYFVGLIVLLCGVGIVYANVKPKEAE